MFQLGKLAHIPPTPGKPNSLEEALGDLNFQPATSVLSSQHSNGSTESVTSVSPDTLLSSAASICLMLKILISDLRCDFMHSMP